MPWGHWSCMSYIVSSRCGAVRYELQIRRCILGVHRCCCCCCCVLLRPCYHLSAVCMSPLVGILQASVEFGGVHSIDQPLLQRMYERDGVGWTVLLLPLLLLCCCVAQSACMCACALLLFFVIFRRSVRTSGLQQPTEDPETTQSHKG